MGLFHRKKKEEPAWELAESQSKEREQKSEVSQFAAQFTGQDTDILAVTAPAGLGYEQAGDSGMWKVTIGLTAWLDEYTHELTQGDGRLEAMVDDTLLEYLLDRVPRNFIIAVTVRPDDSGERFLMLDLPKPGFDPELKALLEVQKTPVKLEVDGLGTFTLNRSLGWFETSVDWMGAEVSLTFDQAEEGRESAQATARALLDAQEDWDARLRGFAAEKLLQQANGLLEEDEEPLDREAFLEQLELDSILAAPDGHFEFWFGGYDLFLTHPIHVTGTLEGGPLLAELETEEQAQ